MVFIKKPMGFDTTEENFTGLPMARVLGMISPKRRMETVIIQNAIHFPISPHRVRHKDVAMAEAAILLNSLPKMREISNRRGLSKSIRMVLNFGCLFSLSFRSCRRFKENRAVSEPENVAEHSSRNPITVSLIII